MPVNCEIEVPSLSDRAWAAGLFEGEGWTSLRKRRYPYMGLGMKDEDIVKRFHKIMGCGTVYLNSHHVTWNNKVKQLWVWNTTNANATHQAMWMLWPWLGPRRRNRMIEVADSYEPIQQTHEKCRPNCACGRHKVEGSKCLAGCTCKRHDHSTWKTATAKKGV